MEDFCGYLLLYNMLEVLTQNKGKESELLLEIEEITVGQAHENTQKLY